MSDRDSTHPADRENLQRLAARGLVLAGGGFWMAAALAGTFAYRDAGVGASMRSALWPLAAAGTTFVVGLYYEQLAAVLLFGASAATLVWGVLYGWELGTWIVMSAILIAPMTLAGVLFVQCAAAEARRLAGERGR